MLHSIKVGVVTVAVFFVALMILCLPHGLGMPDGPAAVLGMCLMMGFAAAVGNILGDHPDW